MSGRLAWVGENWEDFQAHSPAWPDFAWSVYPDWESLWESLPQLMAVVMPLWLPLRRGGLIDALQVAPLLGQRAAAVLLSSAQQEHLWSLQQLGYEVVVRESWNRPWLELCQKLRSKLDLQQLYNPLADFQELVLLHQGELDYQFQSDDAQGRADLLAFLALKGESLAGLLQWGRAKKLELQGAGRKSSFHYSSEFALYAGQAGDRYPRAGWSEFELLKSKGVPL